MGTACKVTTYILLILGICFGLFFIIAAGVFFHPLGKKGTCTLFNNSPLRFIHRGNTSLAQENSLEAAVSPVLTGFGTEFDINVLNTGEFIVFHDDNAKELTGVDKNVVEMTLTEYKSLNYLQTIHGKTYNQTRPVTTFKETIDAVCAANNRATLDLDIKFGLTEPTVTQFLDELDSSSCLCDDTQPIIFATPYFYQTKTLRTALNANNRRCKGQIALYTHQGTYPLGAYLWLRTRLNIWYAEPDIINASKQIWEAHPELLQGFKDDGYCTAVYGDEYQNLVNFDVSSYYVEDVSDASKSTDEYTPKDLFVGLLIMLIIGILLLIGCLAIFILMCMGKICAGNNSKVTNSSNNNNNNVNTNDVNQKA